MHCLSEFDHFLRMTLKGLKQTILVELLAANSRIIPLWLFLSEALDAYKKLCLT